MFIILFWEVYDHTERSWKNRLIFQRSGVKNDSIVEKLKKWTIEEFIYTLNIIILVPKKKGLGKTMKNENKAKAKASRTHFRCEDCMDWFEYNLTQNHTFHNCETKTGSSTILYAYNPTVVD